MCKRYIRVKSQRTDIFMFTLLLLQGTIHSSWPTATWGIGHWKHGGWLLGEWMYMNSLTKQGGYVWVITFYKLLFNFKLFYHYFLWAFSLFLVIFGHFRITTAASSPTGLLYLKHLDSVKISFFIIIFKIIIIELPWSALNICASCLLLVNGFKWDIHCSFVAKITHSQLCEKKKLNFYMH